jgi:hypothetical protein
MPQDTQTFSDITDIDTGNKLRVIVVLKPLGTVKYRCNLNNHCVESSVELNTTYYLDLLTTIDFNIEIISIVEGSGLEINLLEINEKQVLPIYLNQATPQTNYLDKVGTWKFSINEPFYPWYHAISGQGFIA